MDNTLLHSTADWLALTKSWIFDQVRFLAPYCTQAVWCDRRITGPHDDWEGIVITQKDSVLNKFARRFNNWNNRQFLSLSSSVRFEDYYVLFSHFGYRAWHDLMYFKKSNSIKKVVRFYGSDIGVTPTLQGWKERYARIFDAYDLLLCEGPYMAEQLRALQAPSEKIQWIPLGIAPEYIVASLTPTKQLTDPLKILIAGTFTEKKGIDLALQGILEFVRQNRYPITVTLVGDANMNDSEQVATKQRIEKWLERLSSEQTCTIYRLGYISLDKLRQCMQEHLIFLSPSVTAESGDIEGGFPVGLTHAAANGMVLIGSDHCDLPLIVRHNENGFVCRQHSVADIVETLRKIISTDEKIIEHMRQNSLRLVRETFNAEAIAPRLVRMMQEYHIFNSGGYNR